MTSWRVRRPWELLVHSGPRARSRRPGGTSRKRKSTVSSEPHSRRYDRSRGRLYARDSARSWHSFGRPKAGDKSNGRRGHARGLLQVRTCDDVDGLLACFFPCTLFPPRVTMAVPERCIPATQIGMAVTSLRYEALRVRRHRHPVHRSGTHHSCEVRNSGVRTVRRGNLNLVGTPGRRRGSGPGRLAGRRVDAQPGRQVESRERVLAPCGLGTSRNFAGARPAVPQSPSFFAAS